MGDPPVSGADRGELQLLDALVATGAIGSTVQQLADRLGQPSEVVVQGLEDLVRVGRALRIGRGLWIPSEFADLGARDDFLDPAAYADEFRRTSGVALGQYRGPITFTPNDELPIHRWWSYVQGFSAAFVQDQFTRTSVRRNARILDPFCGSGTTLVEARLAGLVGFGCDILAPAVLAARVKTRFELSPDRLRRALDSTIAKARKGRPAPLPFLRETRRQFRPRALEALLRLRAVLPSDRTGVGEALRVAFDAILVPSSRLRRSPCLGYRPPGTAGGSSPYDLFRRAVESMADDLQDLQLRRPSWGPPPRVVLGDSRSLRVGVETVDLAVTSPPYVNGMDYVMNYKLDLAWLGYAESYQDLAQLRERMVACDNLSRRAAEPFLSTEPVEDPWLRAILERIRRNVERKGNYRRQDAHAIVRRYFADLHPVLRRVFRALRPGGRFAIVVGDSLLAGTYIPGDLLLARQGQGVGYEIESVDVARPRRSGQRRSFRLRESIVTLRKPGSVRR